MCGWPYSNPTCLRHVSHPTHSRKPWLIIRSEGSIKTGACSFRIGISGVDGGSSCASLSLQAFGCFYLHIWASLNVEDYKACRSISSNSCAAESHFRGCSSDQSKHSSSSRSTKLTPGQPRHPHHAGHRSYRRRHSLKECQHGRNIQQLVQTHHPSDCNTKLTSPAHSSHTRLHCNISSHPEPITTHHPLC